jgi:nitroreductase
MEFGDVVRRRRMVRNFTTEPITSDVLARVLDAARRAPSAGFAQGLDLLVLEGQEQTERFWTCTFTPDARAGFRWQGLFVAPVIVVPYASPDAYVGRYAEADKAATGLGEGVDRWPVPYWLTDAAMAVENLLLAAVDEGLGALYFGIFHGEGEVRAAFGVPDGHQSIGAVALGHPAPDEPGRSAGRPRRPLDAVVHRGAW